MDRIKITGLRVFAYHGVLDREQEEGQPFVLDLILGVDLEKPCHTDQVEDTINYAEVCDVVRNAMTGCKYRLIERAAQELSLIHIFLYRTGDLHQHGGAQPAAHHPGSGDDCGAAPGYT